MAALQFPACWLSEGGMRRRRRRSSYCWVVVVCISARPDLLLVAGVLTAGLGSPPGSTVS
jgi:hypothetical protein